MSEIKHIIRTERRRESIAFFANSFVMVRGQQRVNQSIDSNGNVSIPSRIACSGKSWREVARVYICQERRRKCEKDRVILTVDQHPSRGIHQCSSEGRGCRNHSGRPGNETLNRDSNRSFSGHGWHRFEAICEVNGDIDLTEEEGRPHF